MSPYDRCETRNRIWASQSKRVLDAVAEQFWLTPVEVVSNCRRKDLAEARHVASWIMHRRLGVSLPQVAALLGRRDHTTALNSVRRVEESPRLMAHAQSSIRRMQAAKTDSEITVSDATGSVSGAQHERQIR